MKWTEITIKTTTEAVEAVTNILYEQNVGGVSIEDPKDFKFQKKNEYDWDFVEEEIFNSGYDGVIIKTYITEERDVTEDINLIKEKIDGLKEFGIDVGDAIVEISQVDEEDWANEWKNYYKPTKVGEKVVVKPTWEEYEAGEGEKTIRLDPGMAFGTGTHPTTKMSLFALEQVLRGGETVIDVGTGSGVLSIASSLLGAKDIYAYDLDEVAVRVAQENIDLNANTENIHVATGNLLQGVDIKADVIVANILADILVNMTEDAYRLVKDEGYLIMSGIISDKWEMVRKSAEDAGFFLETHMVQGEWNTCVFKKTDDISGVIGG